MSTARDAVPLLTPEDVAELAHCTPDTVRDLASQRKLRGVKLGRDWAFPATLLYEDLCTLASAEPKRRGARSSTPSAQIVSLREGGAKRRPPALPELPAAQGGDA